MVEESFFVCFLGIPSCAAAYSASTDRRCHMAIREFTRGVKASAWIGGGIGLVALTVVHFAVGSPLAVFRLLGAGEVLPPLWMLGFFWMAFPVLCGFCAGSLFSRLYGAAPAEAAFWRGCTFLTLSFMCALAWYALLFGKCSLFFSGLCLVVAAVTSSICALSWHSITVGCTLLAAGNALWYVILFFMQIAVVLHN